jgi:two-component system, chemotaxis family, chemotaxis protein CheY
VTRASGTAPRTTVLIVDDDLDLQRLLTRFLTLEGFNTVVAGNGQAALAHLRSSAPVDAILLDLRMPIMDGWTFRQEQRADARIADVPVVVLSGTETDRMGELEAAAWLSKPVSFTDVIAAIRRLPGVIAK